MKTDKYVSVINRVAKKRWLSCHRMPDLGMMMVVKKVLRPAREYGQKQLKRMAGHAPSTFANICSLSIQFVRRNRLFDWCKF